MKQCFDQNFICALQLPMPTKTFAKLNSNGKYIALTVRLGLINKHLSSKQLVEQGEKRT
ncbi:MAG: hypothetical protein ABS944_03970 [Solibacillus sp.]